MNEFSNKNHWRGLIGSILQQPLNFTSTSQQPADENEPIAVFSSWLTGFTQIGGRHKNFLGEETILTICDETDWNEFLGRYF